MQLSNNSFNYTPFIYFRHVSLPNNVIYEHIYFKGTYFIATIGILNLCKFDLRILIIFQLDVIGPHLQVQEKSRARNH
jgi:hypothetical protein